jgi:methionyl-tRNA formyltransferase
MDAELDTGAILAQAPFQLGDEHSWDELEPKLVDVVAKLLPRALERVERDDPGDPQPKGAGEYLPRFEPEYAWIDWSGPVEEIRRKVQAWRFHPFTPSPRGALAELDGETVRVLRVSREPAEGRAVECADGTLWIVESEAA